MKKLFYRGSSLFMLSIFAFSALAELQSNEVPAQELVLLEDIPSHPVYQVKALVRTLDCTSDCSLIIYLGQETVVLDHKGKRIDKRKLTLNRPYPFDYFELKNSVNRLAAKIQFSNGVKQTQKSKLIFKKPRSQPVIFSPEIQQKPQR